MIKIYSDTVECPYCGYKNNMTDALCDGLCDDNTLDWECENENCGKEFEIYVEFEPTYNAKKIEYVKCDSCGSTVRDGEASIYGRTNPFPKRFKAEGLKLCHSCYCREMVKELEGDD
ncbi:hypothetical protein FDC62_08785 [Clostridium botulinum]|uniref:hypothetical protein n=1 Tax=Clostridium botulinum TaxID=1491 RepID=UPI001177CAF7|nr:hypothetical protein [Clostridium botulinum]NFO98297.1 hypothetical protein [Clostridium botulinum]